MPCPAIRKRSAAPATASAGLFRHGAHASDLLQPCLQAELIETADRQRCKDRDALMQHPVGILERKRDLRWRAGGFRRIGNAPMCRHGLAGPEGTRLAGRVVANREYEVERRSARPGELVPGF